MPLIPDVVAGSTIESSWGNNIRDRSVQRFASLAELTSAWPGATDGALAYTSDDDSLWLFRNGAWVQPGAQGRLLLVSYSGTDYTRTTADQPIHASMQSVQFTLKSRRALVIGGHAMISGGAASGARVAIYVRVGTTAVTATTPTMSYDRHVADAGLTFAYMVRAQTDITLDPGTYFIGLWGVCNITWTVHSSTEPVQLFIHDVGPG